MPLTTSQKLNEIKRSFHKYLADSLPGVAIDYDDRDFSPPDDAAFLVIRYRQSSHEDCGIGGVVTGDSPNLRGRWHRIEVNISVYKRDDPQKAAAGELYDNISNLLKIGDITLYDFTDPENPQSAGRIYIDPFPADSGPSPISGRLHDYFGKRELTEAGFAWIGLGVTLSVLEEY